MENRLYVFGVSTWIVGGLLYDSLIMNLDPGRFASLSLFVFCAWAIVRDSYYNCLEWDQTLSANLLLRLIMANFLLAFFSLYYQAEGLSGPTGLLPLSTSLAKSKRWYTEFRVDRMTHGLHVRLLRHLIHAINSLFESAGSVAMVCVYGIGVSGFGTFVSPNPMAFAFCYVAYFGTRKFLPDFLNLQWDALLLEVGVYGFLLSILSMLGESMSSVRLVSSCCMTLFKVLLYRLMFGSGMVKYFSGDVSWRDGTAMNYHFFTQPLPGVIAPLLHAQPDIVKKISCHMALFICELGVPLLSLAPMAFPFSEQWATILNLCVFVCYGILQVAIATGGNFGFFNLLSQALAVCLLTDKTLGRCVSLLGTTGSRQDPQPGSGPLPEGVTGWALTLLVLPWVVLLLFVNLVSVLKLLKHCKLIPEPEALAKGIGETAPLPPVGTPRSSGYASAAVSSPSSSRSTSPSPSPVLSPKKAPMTVVMDIRRRVNSAVCRVLAAGYTWSVSVHAALSIFSVGCHYGLFAHMTKTRDEIILEYSHDYAGLLESQELKGDEASAEKRATWHPVDFRYKPGSSPAEGWVKPLLWPPLHMPRLDWRLWFIPLNGSVQSLAHMALAMRTKQVEQLQKAETADEKANALHVSRVTTGYYTQKAISVLPRWLLQLLCGVLEGDIAVLSLLGKSAGLSSSSGGSGGRAGRALSGDEVLANHTHIRVSLARYSFAPLSLAALSGTSSAWSVAEPRLLLPPLSLGRLFTFLDEKDGVTVASSQMSEADKKTRISQLPKEMRPETAAEIIQRMMKKK